MKLQMIGCSHQNAAVDFREQLSFTTAQAREALDAFRRRFPKAEVVLLSTCNRVELYTAVNGNVDEDETSLTDDESPNRNEVIRFLADQRKLSPERLLESMIYRTGTEAISHLFTVAASLDSMVVGETQILSQVKEAYDLAVESGSVGPLTHTVFQAASRVAKRVQRETLIHRKRVSVPSVAVGEIIPEFFDSLSDKTVVLMGAGEMGGETLRYLIDGGATDIRIANRNRERAETIAREIGGRAIDWSELDQALIDADILIGTTSSSEPIVTKERFARIQDARYQRVLLILDLAVPRDVDPAVGESNDVYLYSVDDLQAACERNRQERRREWPKAQRIIDEETERFVGDLQHRATGPVIRRLRDHAGEMKREEWTRLENRLKQMGVSEDARREIENSMDRLVNKMLHPPLASLRDDAAAGHQRGLLEAIKHLFSLGD
ncbi:MAG: glutamyl-tRNA reductase [Planctomycetaceae bacterium]